MKNNNKILLERYAFKKSGYILLHLLTRTTIRDSVIIHNKESDNFIHENNDSLKGGNFELNDDIIMCLRAGPLAEKYYCLMKCINYDSGISGDDIWHISKLYYDGNDKSLNFEKHIHDLDEETEALIKMYWPFIMIITRKFIKKEDLTVEELNKIWQDFLVMD